MTDCPDPMTPSDCDLQDFAFMPLHVARLRDSDLAAIEDPAACWYATMLWCASWHQIPAASLPNDDLVLARLCGLGRDVKTFRKHRAGALRGFVLCADGRLYHPVVAEQANAAWESRTEHRTKAQTTAERQARWRLQVRIWSAKLRDIGVTPPPKASKEVLRALLAQHCPDYDPDAAVTLAEGGGITDAVTASVTPAVTDVTAKTERGTGTGRGTGNLDDDARAGDPGGSGQAPAAVRATMLAAELDRVAAAGGFALDPSRQIYADDLKRLEGWIAQGLDVDTDILPPIVAKVLTLPPGQTVGSLKFFAPDITAAAARAAAVRARPPATVTALRFDRPGEAAGLAAWRERICAAVGRTVYGLYLDGASLAVDPEKLTIAVSGVVAQQQLEASHRYRIEKLAAEVLRVRLVSIEIAEVAAAA